MKIVGVIPARYNSTRFQGKPLVDIHGKPMIWWVYQQAKKVAEFEEIYIATDDERIKNSCQNLNMNYIMTSESHFTMTSRINEFSKKIDADVYVVVNGDEPLIDPNIIKAVIPVEENNFFAQNLMTSIHDPAEVIDVTNIKVIVDNNNYALYMSRAAIPYPKSAYKFKFFKHIGVIAYSKDALKFYSVTPVGIVERVEDIDYLRFIEHRKPFKMIEVETVSISVDTPKDLEYVKSIMKIPK